MHARQKCHHVAYYVAAEMMMYCHHFDVLIHNELKIQAKEAWIQIVVFRLK